MIQINMSKNEANILANMLEKMTLLIEQYHKEIGIKQKYNFIRMTINLLRKAKDIETIKAKPMMNFVQSKWSYKFLLDLTRDEVFTLLVNLRARHKENLERFNTHDNGLKFMIDRLEKMVNP